MSAFALALALAAQTGAIPALPAKNPSDARARAAAPSPVRSRVRSYAGLTINPAGTEIATIEAARDKPGVAIVIRAVADGRIVRTITPVAGGSYATALTYAPNGDLAWLSPDAGGSGAGGDGGAKGPTAIVVEQAGKQRVIARIRGLVQAPRFSPAGDRVAALVVLNPTKETGATQAGARQIGEIGESADAQQLAVFAVKGPAATPETVRPLSPAGRYIYEYDWMPDGAGLVVTSALGNGDNNWWVATLDRVDAATGAVSAIARPATQLNFPRVSPDGRSVAYIGGLMSDFGSVGGDVWTVPIAGGAPTDITKGAPMSFQSLAWTRGGLRAVALHGDKAEIIAITPGKPMRTGFSQPVSLSASGLDHAAFASDGSGVAVTVQDYTHAPAIYAGHGLMPVQVTHDNDALPAAVRAQSVTWRNEGYTVQGWLLAPLGADPAAKAPMIVQVHGGPSAATAPRFITAGPATEYTDAGYYLFYPNPRGSYGQGEAFTAANRRDFGGGDLRDILAGVDAVEKVAPIDDARLGLAGCSYGGFMAMWANTQTNRFKAIVAGAGLSNLVSYYGTNGIDQWLIPFYGKPVYDDFKVYEDASAVYHVNKARTPTFIYVGERDIEVPPTQSIEWWHALKAKGVDTSLVIYPDAGHCVPRPDQNADVRKRALAWFGKYLGK